MDTITIVRSDASDEDGALTYLINGVDLLELLEQHGGSDGALPFREIGGQFDSSGPLALRRSTRLM